MSNTRHITTEESLLCGLLAIANMAYPGTKTEEFATLPQKDKERLHSIAGKICEEHKKAKQKTEAEARKTQQSQIVRTYAPQIGAILNSHNMSGQSLKDHWKTRTKHLTNPTIKTLFFAIAKHMKSEQEDVPNEILTLAGN